ncbi:hypothetical protein V6X62_01625 [Spiribacter sp. 218]|uniref:hypothetical protein n=1 Tax=Spiribacter pallidus TaxID=1987936 RepID=UPI00349F5377
MDMLIAALIGQAVGVLLWTALLYAPILQWRSRVRLNWNLSYKRAVVISLKAAGMAIVVSMLLGFVAGLTSSTNPLIDASISLAAILAWWFTHSTAVLTESQNTISISLKDARMLSAGVMGWAIGLLFALGLVVAVLGMALRAF